MTTFSNSYIAEELLKGISFREGTKMATIIAFIPSVMYKVDREGHINRTAVINETRKEQIARIITKRLWHK